MTMRVRLAEPRPPGHTVFEHVLLPRLGLPLMATVLADLGHDAAVFCDMLAPIDLDECLTADLVGISATTATQPAGYALADQLSAAGVEVVLGGPHVTFCADEALEHARFVARAGRRGPSQPGSRALHPERVRTPPDPRSLSDQGSRADAREADHDPMGLSVRLRLLLGHRSVLARRALPAHGSDPGRAGRPVRHRGLLL